MPEMMNMPNPGFRNSRAELLKKMGRNPLMNFLDTFAFHHTYFFFDDFQGDTINLDNWAVANSGGAGVSNFATVVGRDGRVQAATGTSDNGSLSMVGPLIYYGDANVVMQARVKTDVVVGLNFEVGLIDGVPGSNAGGVNDEDTPTANMTDGAVISMDTDETFTALGFYTAGTTFTTTRTSAAGVPRFTSGTTPVLDRYFTVRIELITNAAYCFVNGVLIASHTGNKVEGGTALAPWFYWRTRDTTTKLASLDYVAIWAERGLDTGEDDA